MKIEIEFNDLTDVIYALYEYELGAGEHDRTSREDVLAAIAEINRDNEDVMVTLLEGRL